MRELPGYTEKERDTGVYNRLRERQIVFAMR